MQTNREVILWNIQQGRHRLNAADRDKGRSVHRIRKRYRSIFREEVARTVRDESHVEEEMRDLLAALAT